MKSLLIQNQQMSLQAFYMKPLPIQNLKSAEEQSIQVFNGSPFQSKVMRRDFRHVFIATSKSPHGYRSNTSRGDFRHFMKSPLSIDVLHFFPQKYTKTYFLSGVFSRPSGVFSRLSGGNSRPSKFDVKTHMCPSKPVCCAPRPRGW